MLRQEVPGVLYDPGHTGLEHRNLHFQTAFKAYFNYAARSTMNDKLKEDPEHSLKPVRPKWSANEVMCVPCSEKVREVEGEGEEEEIERESDDEDMDAVVCGVEEEEEEDVKSADEKDDIGEARASKLLRDPLKPTDAEVEAHNATHLPFRNWCRICVQAKMKNPGHKKQEERRAPSTNCVAGLYISGGRGRRQEDDSVDNARAQDEDYNRKHRIDEGKRNGRHGRRGDQPHQQDGLAEADHQDGPKASPD